MVRRGSCSAPTRGRHSAPGQGRHHPAACCDDRLSRAASHRSVCRPCSRCIRRNRRGPGRWPSRQARPAHPARATFTPSAGASGQHDRRSRSSGSCPHAARPGSSRSRSSQPGAVHRWVQSTIRSRPSGSRMTLSRRRSPRCSAVPVARPVIHPRSSDSHVADRRGFQLCWQDDSGPGLPADPRSGRVRLRRDRGTGALVVSEQHVTGIPQTYIKGLAS